MELWKACKDDDSGGKAKKESVKDAYKLEDDALTSGKVTEITNLTHISDDDEPLGGISEKEFIEKPSTSVGRDDDYNHNLVQVFRESSSNFIVGKVKWNTNVMSNAINDESMEGIFKKAKTLKKGSRTLP